jgi:hypothetical protein
MPKAKAPIIAATVVSKIAEAPARFAPTKVAHLVLLLRRPKGATLVQMQKATGWQPHSIRGAMSGAIKKKLGLAIGSEKTAAGHVYRIVEAAADDAV